MMITSSFVLVIFPHVGGIQ